MYTNRDLPTAEVEKYLFSQLEQSIRKNSKLIKQEKKIFLASPQRSKIYEFSESFIGIFRKSMSPQKRLHIGFPFPIATKSSSSKSNKLELDFFIRGEKVRNVQKEMIESKLTFNGMNVQYILIKDKKKFRDLTEEICSNKKRVLYVDPYNNQNETHIGNSIIGLHFLDSFHYRFNFKKILVLSNSAPHISCFYDSYSKKESNFTLLSNKSDLVLLPSVVDFRWGEILEEILFFCKKRKPIFLIARNIIIDPREKIVKVYSLLDKDILLTIKGIDDYMDECLDPFVEEKVSFAKPAVTEPLSNVFFINPFSASELKDLTPTMVVYTINQLYQRYGRSCKIFLSRGLKNLAKDRNWLKRFRKKIKQKNYPTEVLYFCPFFENLAQMYEFFGQKRISVALTVDTATSHLVTRAMIPNITFFDARFWDFTSPQSISTLFCRYYPWQIPALFERHSTVDFFSRELSVGLGAIQDHFIQKKTFSIPSTTIISSNLKALDLKVKKNKINNSKNLVNKIEKNYQIINQFNKEREWMDSIYSPFSLYSHLRNKKGYSTIAYFSWRIVPLLKFLDRYPKNLIRTDKK